MKKDLLMGFCSNYNRAKVEPFLASFRHSNADAEIILFTSNMADDFNVLAERCNVRTLDASPFLSNAYHPQSARFFMYQQFLRAHNADFRNVFLSDVRDVVFQHDVFCADLKAEVTFFGENQKIFEDVNYNSAWIKDFYDDYIYDAIAKHQIACSGTTLGSAQGITRYVDLMCGEIASRTKGRWTPHDQGFHNYILWYMKPSFIELDTTYRHVATIGTFSMQMDQMLLTDSQVRIDGAISSVLHQYDRHTDISRFVAQSPWYKMDP